MSTTNKIIFTQNTETSENNQKNVLRNHWQVPGLKQIRTDTETLETEKDLHHKVIKVFIYLVQFTLIWWVVTSLSFSIQSAWQHLHVKAITLFHSDVILKLQPKELERNYEWNCREQRFQNAAGKPICKHFLHPFLIMANNVRQLG